MEKSLEQLKNRIKNKNTLDDEIIYILRILKERKITIDRKLMHSIFYEISSKVKDLRVSELVFDESSVFPYSEELEDALFRLEISGILSYYVSYDSKYDLSYLSDKNNFDERQRIELENAAKSCYYKCKIRQ